MIKFGYNAQKKLRINIEKIWHTIPIRGKYTGGKTMAQPTTKQSSSAKTSDEQKQKNLSKVSSGADKKVRDKAYNDYVDKQKNCRDFGFLK